MNPIKSDDGVRKDHEEAVGDPTSSSSVAGDHETFFTAGEAATASMAKNEADLVVEDDTKNQNSCGVDSNKKRKREDDDKQEQHSSLSKKKRERKTCTTKGCTNKVIANGVCATHGGA
eukprot:scaffold9927_cov49-Skeletonema_menzelii.AAC.1